uniref:Lipocalin n=1 Tax=Haemonchus contortus TaxID=6289 RepID=A0A7I4YJY2_HAECO
MERLFIAFVITGAVTVGQLVPPPKVNGTGHERAHVILTSFRLNANRTVEEDTEIIKDASRFGTIKEMLIWNDLVSTTYNFLLFDTDCSKVVSWLKDLVHSTKIFPIASLGCRPMNRSYYPHHYFTLITRKTMEKYQAPWK